MPNGVEAVCVSTNGGKSSNVEPQWGNVGDENIADGTCFWKLRWEHWSKSVIPMENLGLEYATQTQAQAGTDNTTVMTPLQVLNSKRYGHYNNRPTTINFTPSQIGGALDFFHCVALGGCEGKPNFDAHILHFNHDANWGYDVQFALYNGGRSSTEKLYNDDTLAMRSMDGSGVWSDWVYFAHKVVGQIITYVGDDVPTGYLPCNGAELNPSTYVNLFEVIGTKFGGNGSTTFKLPNLNNNSFLEGSETVGTVKSAGLPNATGNFWLGGVTGFAKGFEDGAFSVIQDTKLEYVIYNTKVATTIGKLNLDLSKSNSVFGASNTVQPKAVTVKYCIKY